MCGRLNLTKIFKNTHNYSLAKHHFWRVRKIRKQLKVEIGLDIAAFKLALKYLHSIGHIVFLQNGLVCTTPTIIPKLLAKFVSPIEVQNNLLGQNSNVQILTAEQIGVVLQIDSHNTKYVLPRRVVEKNR